MLNLLYGCWNELRTHSNVIIKHHALHNGQISLFYTSVLLAFVFVPLGFDKKISNVSQVFPEL